MLIIAGAVDPDGAGDRLLGNSLMLGGVLCWSVYSFLGKRVLRQVGPLEATRQAAYWGTALLTVPVVLRGGAGLPAVLRIGPLLGLGYLSLVCTVFAFVAWYQGLVKVEVSRAAAFLNLVPLSTLAIAALTLVERPTPVQLLGGSG